MAELIYPELSYKIVGILFKVDDEIGYGHRENLYQTAISRLLKENKIPFQEQLKADIRINNLNIKRYYIDYLKAKDIKLGIIANFTKQGVKFKRIINKNH